MRRMMVMDCAVVFPRRMLMARSADLIARMLALGAMRIVAIRAFHVLVKHLAFEERRVFVNLVKNLAVGVIGRGGQHLVGKVVVIVAARGVARGDAPPSRMARGAGLTLRAIAHILEAGPAK